MDADFGDGYLSCDGSALRLRQVDRSIGLSCLLVGCFVDGRDARFVEHAAAELVALRLLAAGARLRGCERLRRSAARPAAGVGGIGDYITQS